MLDVGNDDAMCKKYHLIHDETLTNNASIGC